MGILKKFVSRKLFAFIGATFVVPVLVNLGMTPEDAKDAWGLAMVYIGGQAVVDFGELLRSAVRELAPMTKGLLQSALRELVQELREQAGTQRTTGPNTTNPASSS